MYPVRSPRFRFETPFCETLFSFRPVRKKKKEGGKFHITYRITVEKEISTKMVSDLSGVEVLVLDLCEPDVGILIWGLAEVVLSALLSSALVF